MFDHALGQRIDPVPQLLGLTELLREGDVNVDAAFWDGVPGQFLLGGGSCDGLGDLLLACLLPD